MAESNQSNVSTGRVIRMRELTARIGLSKSEIYRRIQSGTFVKPLSLGLRAVGWRESDIDAWLESMQRGAK
jgi:prophage regulatory protein